MEPVGTPRPGVPSPKHAPCACLRQALAKERLLPPDRRGGARVSNHGLLRALEQWRREAGIPRREILGALEVGAERVLMAELHNWVRGQRAAYLQHNPRLPPRGVGRSDMEGWWQQLRELARQESVTARRLAQAFPLEMAARVKEAAVARRATLAHLKGMTEKLAGDAFWRLGSQVRAGGFEFAWYAMSRTAWERHVRARGFIPVTRHQKAGERLCGIAPGFGHKFWTMTVHRLYGVVEGHCDDPLAMTYDLLWLFFPEWWPATEYRGARERRREAARLRTKLMAPA